MNTKYVMSSSALLMIAVGIACSFMPQEIAAAFLPGTDPLLFQILGALYFAFGMLNWTAKETLIGGIYGRPIAIGNLTHFVVGAPTLIKNILSGNSEPLWLTAAVIYTSFAILFGVIFFRQPAPSA